MNNYMYPSVAAAASKLYMMKVQLILCEVNLYIMYV